ncbi:uncharacterized protein LOC120282437 [Dioscorea cayenensis subsp. rotundata]|uniref:Uncharacterized protein LOC120282437 n=1 Tax=Dioscorea cayennensis subsp. rotundata TaxID=55577 RepID=A0AB40CYT9_DIOCR|nr:uncharacterized protein LOC120282437 [Dioscorea cayenensis subsp. rotundata]
MSIVLGEIGGTRLVGVIGCFLACTAPEITGASPEVKGCLPVEVDEHCISSIGSNSVEASSSIGSNTSNSVDLESDGEGSQEAESRLKGPLETMDALEEALPFRQGISRFLSGKSKKPTNSNHSTSSVNNYASSSGSNSSNSEGKQ